MAFEDADYYECREDVEQLEHESPEEAIESYLDGSMQPGADAEAVIRALCPLVVMAYARKGIADGLAKRWAEQVADDINEWWTDEEYGNPDGDTDDGPGDAILIGKVEEAIREALLRTTVWGCDKVATREYSADEVLALMREHCPEWFEEDASEGQAEPSSGKSGS